MGLWNTETGAFERADPHTAEVISLCFGRGERTAISGSWDRSGCIRKIGSNQRPSDIFLKHDDRVTTLALSPEQSLILTGCADHKIHFWNAMTGEPSGQALGHMGLVSAADFSGDGQVVVSGSWDRTARMWDVTTRRAIGPRIEFKDSVRSVAVTKNASTCIAASADGTARVWQIPSEIKGDTSRIALWCEVMTGMELDANDSVRVLDANTWNDRRRALERQGGAPAP
jgi:WD40 repeat protein